MDSETLKNLVHASLNDGQLALLLSQFGSPAVDDIAAAVFPNHTVNLTAATSADSSDGNGVIVSGIGVDRPFAGLAVTLRVYLEGAEAAIQMAAVADSSWTLAAGLPIFGSTFVSALRFSADSPPTFYVYSHDSADNRPIGLTFEGLGDLDSITGGLAELLGRRYQPLSGPINLSDNGAKITTVNLVAPLSDQVDLGIATVDSVAFRLSNRAGYSPSRAKYYMVPFIELAAEIPFTAQQVHHRLPIAIQATNFASDLRLTASLTDAIDAALDELTALTNGIGFDDLFPAANFHLEDVIKLDEFFFDLSLQGSSLISLIGLGLKSTSPWPIFHFDHSQQDLVVQNILFDLRVVDPFGTQLTTMSLQGEVAIGTAGILVMIASYPDWAVQGHLKQGSVLECAAVFETFLGSSQGVPDLTIDVFDFTLEQNAYALSADVAGMWYFIDDTFGLGNLNLAINYQSADVATAHMAGIVRIAFVDIALKADYFGAASGWTFEGMTGAGQQIHIGTLLKDLVYLFGEIALPSALAELTIENLGLRFNTATKDFRFTCETQFPVDDQSVAMVLLIDLSHANGVYTKTFGGTITIGDLVFDLHFVQNAASNLLVASYSHTGEQQNLALRDLLTCVSSTVADYIPRSLTLDLKNVIFAYEADTTSRFLFSLDVGTSFSLSDLPLVGTQLPADQTIGVKDLQMVVTSRLWPNTTVQSVNALLPISIATKLPVLGDTPQGLSVNAVMQFGAIDDLLQMPVVDQSTTNPTTAPAAPAGSTLAASSDNAAWFTVQKTFGPVHFERVGVQYADNVLSFLLDAALSAAGLTIALQGLSVGSSITAFRPEFDLQGLGITYASGPIDITGAFLHLKVQDGDETYDEYDGLVTIKTEDFGITALGSYAYFQHEPSLFVYGVLDEPLGGPAFFFVTGLAAAFGYNRAFLPPSVDQVVNFPLVTEALNPSSAPLSDPQAQRHYLMTKMQRLHSYIPPSLGDYFLSVGVKFTSFKVIDAFVLLTASFGSRFAINLLGMANVVVPTPAPGTNPAPLAQVQLTLNASYIPDQGELTVSAQLTSASYILSRACHLTGGFALSSWFDPSPYAGDFVLSVGGYHPDFDVPSHYPTVPRLSFNWNVNSEVSLKGSLYYAMTGAALMAGGSLKATWESGSLKAWFNADANFLIAWQPYHYDATISVDMGVSYTFHFFGTHHLNVDVGADLHLWGPEFSGKAHIKLSVVSFDVAFGAKTSTTAKAIEWAAFKRAFLPSDTQICTIGVQSGLVSSAQDDAATIWVINARELVITTDAVIPSKEYYAGPASITIAEPHSVEFGIGSMNLSAQALTTRQTLTIIRDGDDVGHEFMFTPIRKAVPRGLWGQKLRPSLTDTALIADVVTGFELRPAAQPAPGATAAIDRDNLRYATTEIKDAFGWEDVGQFVSDGQSDEQRRTTLAGALTSEETAVARRQILADLGLPDSVMLRESLADVFLVAPDVGAW